MSPAATAAAQHTIQSTTTPHSLTCAHRRTPSSLRRPDSKLPAPSTTPTSQSFLSLLVQPDGPDPTKRIGFTDGLATYTVRLRVKEMATRHGRVG
ncbi:hypothetical protein RHGRI_022037 [Rhododendron griersonianum]|uniref:Uncharacterized protein n=1 Tax=Rhododendron griersonianum TaxID=479676 RepID=A0AAV6JQK3_9ERIC|nr:hypothetical protein RHGRI_022037 [Rhododendron griersonianum]